jgi:uncharacterized protein YkwD
MRTTRLTFGFTAALATAALHPLSPALALDLNSFRAQHGRPALAASPTLAAAAYEHARDMARRRSLDHKGYRARLGFFSGTAAENVLVGCPDEDCAIRGWARSGGHRRNMLRGDVSAYGLASASGDNGRRYWVLVLGSE